jgi:hypothetical protein
MGKWTIPWECIVKQSIFNNMIDLKAQSLHMMVTILLRVVLQFSCQLCNASRSQTENLVSRPISFWSDRDLCENNNGEKICMDLILKVQIRFLWVFRPWRSYVVLRGFESSNSSKTKTQNRTHDQSLHRPYSLTNNPRCTPHLSPDQKPEMNRTHDQELHISTHSLTNKSKTKNRDQALHQ